MTINANIVKAASLIADIDPGLAKAFINSPFNRHLLVTAFHNQLLKTPKYAGLADRIAVALRSAIDSTAITR